MITNYLKTQNHQTHQLIIVVCPVMTIYTSPAYEKRILRNVQKRRRRLENALDDIYLRHLLKEIDKELQKQEKQENSDPSCIDAHAHAQAQAQAQAWSQAGWFHR